MQLISDKGKCPLCYVKTLFGRCVKICKVKDIEKYVKKIQHFNPHEEQDRIRNEMKKRQQIKQQRENEHYITTAQRNILQWLRQFKFSRENKNETFSGIFQWIKNLFKPSSSPAKSSITPGYDVAYK